MKPLLKNKTVYTSKCLHISSAKSAWSWSTLWRTWRRTPSHRRGRIVLWTGAGEISSPLTTSRNLARQAPVIPPVQASPTRIMWRAERQWHSTCTWISPCPLALAMSQQPIQWCHQHTHSWPATMTPQAGNSKRGMSTPKHAPVNAKPAQVTDCKGFC